MIPYVLDDNKSLSTLISASNNGLGRLTECQSFIVHETLNGEYTAKMEVPIVAYNSGLLHHGGIIKAKADNITNWQLFRIHSFSKSLKAGMIVCEMNHISYDLNKIVTKLRGEIGASPSGALTVINNHTVGTNPFTITTTQTANTGRVEYLKPLSIKDALMGENSILSTWGGDIYWDNLNVQLMDRRGEDKLNVVVEYGKNILDAKQEYEIDNTYTHLLGYAFTPAFGTAIVDDRLVEVVATDYPRVMLMDFSNLATNEASYAGNPLYYIHKWATEYVEAHDISTPRVSISVDFLALESMKEYELIHDMQSINLGDKVTVKVAPMGMNLEGVCIEREYDTLNERHTKVQLGDYTKSLSNTLAGMNKANADEIQYIRRAMVQTATNASNGLMSASDKAKLDNL